MYTIFLEGKIQFNGIIIESGETDTVYSDRLLQWDYEKHNSLCKKYFGNEGQYWSGRDPKTIEKFLQDYLEKPNLVLCKIEQLENQSNGYPYWRFDYKCV